jgi:hypothetical protein
MSNNLNNFDNHQYNGTIAKLREFVRFDHCRVIVNINEIRVRANSTEVCGTNEIFDVLQLDSHSRVTLQSPRT